MAEGFWGVKLQVAWHLFSNPVSQSGKGRRGFLTGSTRGKPAGRLGSMISVGGVHSFCSTSRKRRSKTPPLNFRQQP